MGNCWNQLPAHRPSFDFQVPTQNYHSHAIQQSPAIHVSPQRREEGKKLASAPSIEQPQQHYEHLKAKKTSFDQKKPFSNPQSKDLNQRDSLEHIGAYQHVHFVRPPSYTESEGRMAKLQSDSGEIWNLITPEMKLISREPYRPNLSWIREQPRVVRS